MVKKNNQGVILIDILIILCLATLIFIGYYEFRKKNVSNPNEPEMQKAEEKKSTNNQTLPASLPNATNTESPDVSTTAPAITTTEATPNKNEKSGFYQNSTYFYSISYPPEWPVKERSAENVSVGIVPPKNGVGAITIEVSQTSFDNEINQTKNEIKKYSFIELKETPYVIDGITGTKFSLSNTAINTTNVIITLEKNKIFYALKYAEESENFIKAVENALLSFKFTK